MKTFKPESEIKEIDPKHKCNVFFMLMVKDDYKKYLKIKAFEESGLLKKVRTDYICNLVHSSDYYSNKDELVKFLLYQVYSNKQISNLTIEIKDIFYKTSDRTNIVCPKTDEFFYMNSLDLFKQNDFFDVNPNIAVKEYLLCFFGEQKIYSEKFHPKLLKSIISKIYTCDIIELKANDILKFFKKCCENKIEINQIDSLEIKKEKEISELNKEYYISDEDLDKIKNIKKTKFLQLLIEIFAIY